MALLSVDAAFVTARKPVAGEGLVMRAVVTEFIYRQTESHLCLVYFSNVSQRLLSHCCTCLSSLELSLASDSSPIPALEMFNRPIFYHQIFTSVLMAS